MDMKSIPTEQRNPDTLAIDEVSTIEMLRMFNNEDKKVAYCVEEHLDEIARAVDVISEIFADGGRIVYCGAGTSGRMGFLDSAECPPTFGLPYDRVISLMAGGPEAMLKAKEGAEDSRELCVEDLKAISFCSRDILVGIAASGRTPYVVGGLEYAKQVKAKTVAITCNGNPDCIINQIADIPISIYAGPEAITGSTRMKAGTVQKMVLNMISSAVMIKTGKLYSNLMVNLQTTNEKLANRAKNIIAEITGAPDQEIEGMLRETDSNVCLSIFMLLTGLPKEQAELRLKENHGHIKKALKASL